ncbi:hypothetical protein PUNSTDRAFT_44569 [Punctularia strigosozonata HHB-11173 SS5]|uniref:uncharacterized protein n=1 Tax=Punctularia strigosozonata (strain HHB-11173) TaxID=741275 RepID=UPI0004417C40|nr:uncharacterized protein PUNSTDRAFT_44569 [Punctularia strigosozonata HHB-11173 SS5]EIN09131.1 hypothetical protein PUNSTDRAFT_44569 [Punctularia strigosozonata HHB-11173 SS5]
MTSTTSSTPSLAPGLSFTDARGRTYTIASDDNETASNLSGPGRLVGNAISRAGKYLQRIITRSQRRTQVPPPYALRLVPLSAIFPTCPETGWTVIDRPVLLRDGLHPIFFEDINRWTAMNNQAECPSVYSSTSSICDQPDGPFEPIIMHQSTRLPMRVQAGVPYWAHPDTGLSRPEVVARRSVSDGWEYTNHDEMTDEHTNAAEPLASSSEAVYNGCTKFNCRCTNIRKEGDRAGSHSVERNGDHYLQNDLDGGGGNDSILTTPEMTAWSITAVAGSCGEPCCDGAGSSYNDRFPPTGMRKKPSVSMPAASTTWPVPNSIPTSSMPVLAQGRGPTFISSSTPEALRTPSAPQFVFTELAYD